MACRNWPVRNASGCGLNEALGKIVHAEFQISRRKLNVHALLARESQRNVGFRLVLDLQSRSGSSNITSRLSDVQGATDLGALFAELTVVLTVYALCEGEIVFENAQRFARNLGNG